MVLSLWLTIKQMVSLLESSASVIKKLSTHQPRPEVSRFSFRGSHNAQNLQKFERNWMFSRVTQNAPSLSPRLLGAGFLIS